MLLCAVLCCAVMLAGGDTRLVSVMPGTSYREFSTAMYNACRGRIRAPEEVSQPPAAPHCTARR